jgi:acetolactate synthase-1/2/3 large subunit
MKTSDFLVEFLINKGVTDVFGIPGGVILDFLDSINKKGNTINARLNFNEQASSFAANGYAQASGKLAVAYATRGPGITNMITGILDSFGDSFPVLFITAHSKISKLPGTGVEETQEFDTTKLVSSITKYAVKIECLDSVQYELEKSFYLATSGRPGPVVIDFLSSVLAMDINIETQSTYLREKIFLNEKSESIINSIENELKKAKRPVLLIGNGIRQSNMETYIKKIAKNWAVPILSSRSAQDIIPGNENYFGYIGSHAIRYSNFILSKCDLILALGNSLMFNPESESFGTITKNAKILRINVDANEFLRELPNSICYDIDLKDIMHTFEQHNFQCDKNWLDICKQIKMKLYNYDTEYPVNMLALLINAADMNTIIISDVGNNEFWLSRAYIFSGATNRILYSISFSSLG